MKNLQEIKEEVATELGYKSNSVFSAHEQLLINPHGLNYKVISNCNDQIAIRYAQEQNKELVEMLDKSRLMIGKLKRSMLVHPDCELGSEFCDYTTDAQNLEDEIEELIKSATEG